MIRRTVTQAALVAPLLLVASACAAETTIALAVTPPKAPSDKPLADALLPLAEIAVASQDGLQLVERKQARQLLAELARARALAAADQALAIGRLAAADLLVAIELAPPGDDEAGRHAVVRVTEGPTAVVRGVAAVPISPASIEDAADELARYVASHADDSRLEKPTIAVLPFESIDRFDRVRPLERGLRDLFATALLDRGECRVVQRSGMGQLLAELDLVRAGLTNGGADLDGAPSRQATYVLRGNVDARGEGEGKRVLVNLELLDAASQKVVVKTGRSCPPKFLPGLVSKATNDLLAAAVANGPPKPVSPASTKETVDELFTAALRDVYRFIRISPDDDGYRPFYVYSFPRPTSIQPRVNADTPLGGYLLRKSIDRLESALFIDPSRTDVALALGYCLSFHVDGVFQPERCELLLRRVLDESTNPRNRQQALKWLADRYFPHRGGFHQPEMVRTIDPELLRKGFESRLEAFQSTPPELRNTSWARMMDMLRRVCETTYDIDQCRRTIDAAIDALESADKPPLTKKTRGYLASEVVRTAYWIGRRRDAPAETRRLGVQTLRKWLDKEDASLRLMAARHLRYLQKITSEEHAAVIEGVLRDDPDTLDESKSTKERVLLASIYRRQGAPAKGARLLEAAPHKYDPRDFAYGDYGYELGRCYEAMGWKAKARDTYLHYAEKAYGLTYSSDVVVRLRELGGVPLDPARDIDVRYVDNAEGKPIRVTRIATDGRRLFYGAGSRRVRQRNSSYYNRRYEPIPHVKSFEPATGEWRDHGGPPSEVRRLVVADGFLWAGTSRDGVWRMTLDTGEWRQWSRDDGLPADAVIAVAPRGKHVYLSVGTLDDKGDILSGGVVRLEPGTDVIHAYRGGNAPKPAPATLTIVDEQLFAKDRRGKWAVLGFDDDRWRIAKKREGESPPPRYGYKTDIGSAKGFFSIERGGRVWSGGEPPNYFSSSGLSHRDLATGKVRRYGPRDGFRYIERRTSTKHRCTDGVWLDGELWLATSFGLAVVTPRDLDRADQAEAANLGGTE